MKRDIIRTICPYTLLAERLTWSELIGGVLYWVGIVGFYVLLVYFFGG